MSRQIAKVVFGESPFPLVENHIIGMLFLRAFLNNSL